MNKKLKRANERLDSAREYAARVTNSVCQASASERSRRLPASVRAAVKPSLEDKKKEMEKAAEEEVRRGRLGYKTYRRCEVVKFAKGDFRVEADGVMIERKFKSITSANEWIAVHTS